MDMSRVHGAHQNINRLLREIGSAEESPLFGEIFETIKALTDEEREQLTALMQTIPLNGVAQ